jgi:adenylate cyclase
MCEEKMDQSHILVVDDNEMNRDMLSRRLTRQGHEVTVAEDGQRALTVISEGQYDLVLLDIMMPKMNGYEVLERMKADTHLQNIPVIMISAVDDLDSVVKCIEMGAEDYLFKPFNPVLLKARVDATLEKRRLYKQNRMTPEKLKTSLESIKQSAEHLLAGNEGSITERQTQIIEDIRTAVNGLIESVDK